MITGIKCCKECVAPKRQPGCHSKCSEYLREKKAYEEHKKAISNQRQIDNALYEQRYKSIYKSLWHKRK